MSLVLASVASFAVAQNPAPVVQPIYDDTFLDFADLSTRAFLRQVPRVDFNEYPQLKPVYEKLLRLANELVIPEDGKDPVRLILVDDRRMNMAFVRSDKGSRALLVNLGALSFAQNDDELAYMLGHEFEHGHSKIQNRVDAERYQGGNGTEIGWLQRSVETEVDIASVFRRVHRKGYNPYRAPKLLDRLVAKYGDVLSGSHNLSKTRRSYMEMALTALTRKMGEIVQTQVRHDIVNSELEALFSEPKFLEHRRAQALRARVDYDDLNTIFTKIKALGTTDGEAARTRLKREIQDHYEKTLQKFRAHYDTIERFLGEDATPAQVLDFQLRTQGDLGNAIFKARREVLGENFVPVRFEQYDMLMRMEEDRDIASLLKDQAHSTPLGEANEQLRRAAARLNEAQSEVSASRAGTAERLQAESELVAAQREYQKVLAHVELTRSAYSDLASAEKLSQRAMKVIEDTGWGGVIPLEFWELKKQLASLEKHVGPSRLAAIRAKEELRPYFVTIGREAILGPENKNLLRRYRDFSKAEGAEIFPSLLREWVSRTQRDLAAAAGDAQKVNKVILRSYKFLQEAFGISGRSHGFEEEFAANRVGLEKLTRDWLDAIVGAATDAEALGWLRFDLVNSRSKNPFSIDLDGGTKWNSTFLNRVLRPETADKFLKLRFATHKQRLEKLAEIPRWGAFLQSLDGFVAETEKAVDSLHLDSEPTRAMLRREFAAIFDILPSKLSPELRRAFGTPPDYLPTFLRWRYPRISGLLDGKPKELRLEQERVLKLLNETKGNAALRKATDREWSFDTFVAMARATKTPPGKAYAAVLDHMDLFGRGPSLTVRAPQSNAQFSESRREFFLQALKPGHSVEVVRNALNVFQQSPVDSVYSEKEREEKWMDEVWRERQLEHYREARRRDSRRSETEILREAFGKTLVELGGVLPKEIAKVAKIVAKDDNAKMDFLVTYAQVVADHYPERDVDYALKETEKAIFGEIKRVDDLRGFDTRRKIAYLNYRPLAHSPAAFQDEIFEHVWSESESSPELRRGLRDEALVASFFYNDTKRALAQWQLDDKHRIEDTHRALKAGKIHPPRVDEQRAVIADVQRTLDLQFPENTAIKSAVLDHLESRLQVSPRESKFLNASRMSLDKWTNASELMMIDIPEIIAQGMTSAYEHKELLDFLLGRREAIPQFVENLRRQDSHDPDAPVRMLRHLHEQFTEANVHARTAVLQTLLDQRSGMLSEPAMVEEVHKLILGDYYTDEVFRSFFEAYVDASPEAEQRVIMSHILASYVEHGGQRKKLSLKAVLEAMGPFGIKAGQFLRSSGLVSPELARELNEFFDSALPPNRPKIVKDLENVWGVKIHGIERVRGLAGSGSINYVVRVDFAGGRPAVVRIRRDAVEGLVHNENEIWRGAIERLRRSGTPRARDLAEVIDEARQHSYETLKPGGSELDLSIERRNYAEARVAYEADGDDLTGYRVEVARPLEDLQRSVPEEWAHLVSVYEYVPNVPLSEIRDPSLRRNLARQIVNAELSALFERGVFDPDGHPGNWLVDTESRRLVRIDIAQMRRIGAEESGALRTTLRSFAKGKIDAAEIGPLSAALAKLFVAEPAVPELEASIRTVLAKTKLPKSFNPQEHFFHLRQELEAELRRSSGTTVKISLHDSARSALSSLSRLMTYREHMQDADFLRLYSRYLEIDPGNLVNASKLRAAEWIDKVKGGWEKIRRRWRPESAPDRNLAHVDEDLRAKAETLVDDRTAPAVAPAVRKPDYQLVIKNAKVTVLEDGRRLYHITPKQFEQLPLGAVLHDEGGNLRITGVDGFDTSETRGGYMGAGVLDGEHQKHPLGYDRMKVEAMAPASLDLRDNALGRMRHSGESLVLLTPEQYRRVPDGTLIYRAKGGAFVKGKHGAPVARDEEVIEGFVQMGFKYGQLPGGAAAAGVVRCQQIVNSVGGNP